MTRSRQGKFCGGTPPYGLKRDPEEKGHLLIDPETAPVIRKIYDMALDGWGCMRIAKRLMEDKAPITYHQSGCRKPFDRLWISSMEDSTIREGFQKLKPSAQYDSLYHAALCRERADWIIGINATRLFSCLYGQPLAIGRVMTPTLGMTVQREAAIAAFVPEPFYTVQLCVNGMELGSKRFPDRDSAASLLAACKKEENVLIQSIDRKERAEKAPELYDLTTLQRDANRILGFTAQQTLDYTQSLYEKKLVTYPRTDSRYLTEDAAPILEQLVPVVATLFHVSGEVALNTEQVINNKKVSDHHAPLDPATGKAYQLHHIGQKADGTLAVLTEAQHQGNSAILNIAEKASEIDRPGFGNTRKEFWQYVGNHVFGNGGV